MSAPVVQAVRSAIASLPREAAVILVTIPFVMTTLWYFGRIDFYYAHLHALVPPDWPMARMYPFFYFSLSCVVLRTGVPLILMRLLGRRPREYGYSPRGTFEFAWGYAILFAAVVPFLWYASTLPSFQSAYPFCSEAIVDGRIRVADFVVYQCFYALIFVSGESYWRGFVLFGLERAIGYLAIFVMVIPYCMSHYGKPPAEAFASVLTGIVLGFLALRHRSFWLGVAVHWSAAIVMDATAIIQRGIEVAW
jgi:hypothetical protein